MSDMVKSDIDIKRTKKYTVVTHGKYSIAIVGSPEIYIGNNSDDICNMPETEDEKNMFIRTYFGIPNQEPKPEKK